MAALTPQLDRKRRPVLLSWEGGESIALGLTYVHVGEVITVSVLAVILVRRLAILETPRERPEEGSVVLLSHCG